MTKQPFFFIFTGSTLFFILFFFITNTAHHADKTDKEIIFEIKKGETALSISKRLEKEDIIANSTRFWILGRVLQQWKKLKSGEYALHAHLTALEIFRIFRSGVSILHLVTIKEGQNIFEIASIFEHQGLAHKERFLNLCKDPSFMKKIGFSEPLPETLEGYLFPDTYALVKGTSEEDIIRQMCKHFFKNWTPLEEARAKNLGFSLPQILTLASIIEKETGAHEERALVSAVFHNRLKKRMKIQSDPTTIYGIWATYLGRLYKKDLTTKTLYNTYSFYGLPIGPICNPGKASLQAALYPATSDYLYFVSKKNGFHYFSKSLKEHNEAVQKYQK